MIDALQVSCHLSLLQDRQRYAEVDPELSKSDSRSMLGEIPSFKLLETELSFVVSHLHTYLLNTKARISFSFLDIGPLSRGHALIIPKC